MSCVVTNPVNCEHIRSVTINQINADKTVTTVVLYYNVMTSESVSTRDAQQCPNIQPLPFTCAMVCNQIV